MAQEMREISFTAKEFAAALSLYAAQIGQTPVSSNLIQRVELDGSDELTARLIAAERPDPIKMSAGDILSALISFCIQCRIPLPKSASKSVRRIEDRIVLVINNWRLSTPMSAAS
ncbi:MAG: hypothetical protein AAF527_03450 [Pseudomonadota bacterium]